MAARGDHPGFRRGVQAALLAIAAIVFCFPAALSTPAHLRIVGREPPWPYRWDPVFGTSTRWVLIAGVATVVLGLAGYLVERSSRRPDLPAAPLRYAPPEGLGPVQGAIAWSGEYADGAVTATVMHLANLGLVGVHHDGDSLVVRGLQEESSWQSVDEVSQQFARELGIMWKNAQVDLRAAPGSEDLSRLRRALFGMHKAARGWAFRYGLTRNPRHVALSFLAFFVSASLGTFLTLIVHFFVPVLIGPPLLAYAVMAGPMLNARRGLTFTHRGVAIRQEISGFRRLLSTPGAADRADFARRNDLYFLYLPWAVVLGCAEEWEETYAAAFGPTTEPGWLDGGSLKSFVTETRSIDTELTEHTATGTLEKS